MVVAAHGALPLRGAGRIRLLELTATAPSAASTSGRGSRGLRTPTGESRLRSSQRRRVLEDPQPAVGDQRLVDPAHAAGEGGEDGGAERHRLAVHRPPRADHEVGVGDQALGVDRPLGDDQVRRRRAARAASPCSSVRGMTTACASAPPARRRSSPRRGRWGRGTRRSPAAAAPRPAPSRGRGRARRAPPGRARSRPGSTPPSGPGSGPASRPWRRAWRRRSSGIDSGASTRRASAEGDLALQPRELVVLHLHRGDAESGRDDGEVDRAVADRQLRPPLPDQPRQPRRAPAERPHLAQPRGAAVLADRRCRASPAGRGSRASARTRGR